MLFDCFEARSHRHYDVEAKKNNHFKIILREVIEQFFFLLSLKRALKYENKTEHNNNKQTNDLVLKSTCHTQIAHTLSKIKGERCFCQEKSEFELPGSQM